MRVIAIATALMLSTTLPTFASDDDASCGNISSEKWMSKEAIKSKATEMGFDVRRVQREDGCYEVYAIDKDGVRFELYMNPATGEVVNRKHKS